MAAIFEVTLNVKDVNTQIELPSWTWQGVTNSPWRAERMAIRAFKGKTLEMWSARICDKYGLTATQLERLIEDGLITPPDLFEVTVAFTTRHRPCCRTQKQA